LYAIGLAWPADGDRICISSLGTAKYADEITDIRLLGSSGELQWERTPEGLEVELPDERPSGEAFVLRVERRPLF
jgi:hypothetical protein